MLDVVGNTPVNLSKPGSPAPSSDLLATTLPDRSQHHAPGHELLVHCQAHASGSTMAAQQVTARFAYQKPGIEPPVYIAGSFSNPPWQPHQMEAAQRDDGEYLFTKSWPVEAGADIQYKYRIGDGDWWVLDETEQTTDDGHGNLNNILSTARLTSSSNDDTANNLMSSRIEALRASETPNRTVTPDFVKTTIEVSNSAALLHDEVPSRQIPRHVPTDTTDLSLHSHTPSEEVAETAAEVADTAAQLDQEQAPGKEDDNVDPHRDDPPMLAHECMFGEDSQSEYTSRPLKSPLPSPNHRFGHWDADNSAKPEADLDDPRLERFPSERSAIYAAVRRLSTSVDQDDIGETLAVPHSPRASDDKALSETSVASPVNIEGSADSNRWLRASDASHSPDREGVLRSVSSLHSIPEGDDDEKSRDSTHEGKPSEQSDTVEPFQMSDGGGHVDDEGIAMNIPSHERKPQYTWEKESRDRRGSVTERDVMFGTEDAGPSKVAVNHTHNDTPDVLVHGPDLVVDGEDGAASSGDDMVSDLPAKDDTGVARAQASAQQPDTRTSTRSVQTVASMPSPESSAAWLMSWFRLLFIDFFGGIFKKLFKR